MYAIKGAMIRFHGRKQRVMKSHGGGDKAAEIGVFSGWEVGERIGSTARKQPAFWDGVQRDHQMVTVLVQYGTVSVSHSTDTVPITMCLKLGAGVPLPGLWCQLRRRSC